MKAIIKAFGFTSVYTLTGDLTAKSIAAGFGITDAACYQEFEEADFEPTCYLAPQCFSLEGGVVSYDYEAAKLVKTELDPYNGLPA